MTEVKEIALTAGAGGRLLRMLGLLHVKSTKSNGIVGRGPRWVASTGVQVIGSARFAAVWTLKSGPGSASARMWAAEKSEPADQIDAEKGYF